MKTPDIIYLIDTGDEISWCDDPNPSGEFTVGVDSIAYIKKEIYDKLILESQPKREIRLPKIQCAGDLPYKTDVKMFIESQGFTVL